MVRRHCGKFIAGPIVAALGLVGAFIAWRAGANPEAVKLIAWVSAAIFPISIFPAQYGAWKEERRATEAERAKNLKPEVKGTVDSIKPGPRHGNSLDHLRTNVSEEVIVRGALPPGTPLPKTWRTATLEYGSSHTFSLSYEAEAEGRPEKVLLDKLVVKIIDGFGDAHPIQMKGREWVIFNYGVRRVIDS